MNLIEALGPIDIYLVDQLMKGRIRLTDRILDAGCGGGRNLAYLMRQGADVYGVDQNPEAIASVRQLASDLGHSNATDAFRLEPVEKTSFEVGSMDVVLCSAVLHFARDEAHFQDMVEECWRALKPGGLFFARLASDIGMEGRFEHLGGRRYLLLDGSERFLVDEPYLLEQSKRLDGELLDPIKTTVVQSMRCMTTWVLAKPA